MRLRFAVFALLLLAGCVSAPRQPSEHGTTGSPDEAGGPGMANPPGPPGSRYEIESGRDAAMVADLRAAAAPEVPTLQPGRNPASDNARLAAQGYVRIGNGYFPFDEAQTRDAAVRQGQDVGADRILLYPPQDENGGGVDWVAAYYVRFKLPFGATFRDLRAQERTTMGVNGGVAIGSVVGGTPASRANLLAGDAVLALDDRPIANRAEFQDALKRNAGRAVTLTVVRNGETLKRMVRLGAWSAADR